MKMKTKREKVNIESVIEQRLKMQSNQRLLAAEFAILDFQLDKIVKSVYFNYPFLKEEKKKKLINTLGGEVNYHKTKKYLEDIIKV